MSRWLRRDGAIVKCGTRRDLLHTLNRCVCERTKSVPDHHLSTAARLVCLMQMAWEGECVCRVACCRLGRRTERTPSVDLFRWPKLTDDFAKYAQNALDNHVYWSSRYPSQSPKETEGWKHEDRSGWYKHPTKRRVLLKPI